METLPSPAGQTDARLSPDNKTRSQCFPRGKKKGCPSRRDGISNSKSITKWWRKIKVAFPPGLGLNPISPPSRKTSSAMTTSVLRQKAARWGEQEYWWCDPNLSASPTQGGHTDTETHPLVCDLWGGQPNCAILALLLLQVLSTPTHTHPLTHTRLRARPARLLRLRRDEAPGEQR